jgi:hypothetical protein
MLLEQCVEGHYLCVLGHSKSPQKIPVISPQNFPQISISKDHINEN